jgi:UDP-N-acetylmuramate dehydrogenase
VAAVDALEMEHGAAIPTWFRVGGTAARLVKPADEEQVVLALSMDPALRVLGDGANLLVDDEGPRELVLAMTPRFREVEFDEATGLVRAQAGADLPKLVTESVRRGWKGLEGLGGIPASVGGAVVMNAGGRFGQIGDVVREVEVLTRDGRRQRIEASRIAFGYRTSGLEGVIVLGATLALTRDDPAALRATLKDVMAYKKKSQPMAADSAGCCFENPTLGANLEGVGAAGSRVSAGLLIDRAGLKGLAVRGASVSTVHANFLVTGPGAKARDVIELMILVRRRVFDRFGVELTPEVAVWTCRDELRHGLFGALADGRRSREG